MILKEHKKLRVVFVAVTGGLVLCGGIVMIPYPGPGWAAVFAGLAILSTEFKWAKRILKFARERYQSWVNWQKQQALIIRVLISGFTLLVVIVTLWLLNAYGMIADLLHIDSPWLHSPLI